jgi:hypothetical protein
MSAPKLTIAVEPVEAGKAVYLPIAATAADQGALVKIVLRLRITNGESKKVVVSGIQFSFPGSPAAPIMMQGVDLVLTPDGSTAADAKGALAPGQTATWSNGVVALDKNTTVSNAVYLPAPAPAKITASVSCSGFGSPASVTLALAPYTGPTPAGAFLFPFSAGDLRDGEFAVTSAQHWANGGAAGGQIFAHDILVQGVDPQSKQWTDLLPGGSGMKNEDYRIWGKPVRAVAAGTVEAVVDGVATNSILGKFPDPTPQQLAGNHFWIRHDNVFVLYAHLQKGTIPATLKQKGAPVKAGQLLGLAGNSGNTTKPHTHIQCARDSTSGALRPMPFRNCWVLDRGRFNPPSPDGPWVRLTAQGICKDTVAIWPESTWPTFKIPAAGIARSGDWANRFWISPDLNGFKKEAQALFDKEGKRLIYVTSYLENGQRRWVGIARSGDWANSFWISPDVASFSKQAQDLFDQQGRRLVHVTTYLENGQRHWVGIARSGDWANSFWISPDENSFKKEAQDLFDGQGRRLVYVTTYEENGQRRWAGIARSGDWASSFWISPDVASFTKEAQDLFDQKGQRLIHVTTYAHNGQRHWVGIARSGDWANSFWISPDLDSFELEAQDLFDHQGRRLMAVDFLAD